MPSTIHIPRSSSPLFSCPSSSSKRATAEDISRLLDPSYSSTQQTRSVSVYIDGHGDLHDPDYRHFPAIIPPRSAKRHSHYSSTNYPLWDEHAVDDEEIDEDDHLYNHHSPIRHSPSSRRSSSTTVSRNNFASSSSRTSSPPSYHYATYSTYDISPPTSYDSDDILSTSFSSYTSPFEEKEKRPSKLSTKRKRCSSKEELLDTPTPITRSLLPTTEEEEDVPEAVGKDDSDDIIHFDSKIGLDSLDWIERVTAQHFLLSIPGS
ncbi:hypothetical protein K443DRAFT_10105 [Laccaria amethystina LaAM-08-1]|uniref:Uncharacterized protein n=1 Tax=Laccaria amethystina LaAM-08-1 TaxID=1095629 RepID=A0A0C9WLB3_9AGAR|nr:hypothetical protein K443DRAFT_10105 [Laccaria amethystina LaAM-08-1]